MSLKSFHLFFILISILLSGFLGFWGIQKQVLPMIAFAGVTGVALIFYFVWFVKKSKGAVKLALGGILLVSPKASQACAVCFGVTDFQTRQANNNAILFLLGLTTLMLVTVSYFVFKTLRSLPTT